LYARTLLMNRYRHDRSWPAPAVAMEATPQRGRCSIRSKSAHPCTDPLTVVQGRDTVAATRKGVWQEGLK
jgi:hypothetical protein